MPRPSEGLPLFFVATFAVTWGCQLPAVLARDPAPLMPLVVLGVLGPMLAAVLVCAREEGRAGVAALFAPLRRWRVPLGWYATAVGHSAALLALGMAVYLLVGGEGALAYPPREPARLVAALIIAIGEEVGWRGFALPRLLRATTPVRASVVLGVIWAVWHVPMLAGAGVPLTLLPVMIVFFSAGSVMFTWIWLRTGGSLLLAVLAHFGAHLSNSHLPLPGDVAPLVAHTIALVVAAVVVVALDRETFAREPG